MQVHEYLFRSPYPNRIQVGTPENTTQKSDTSAKGGIEAQNKKVQTDIKNAEVKATTNDIKTTKGTNKLDIYA